MNALTLLILAHVYFSVFYLFFILILRDEKRHALNRMFLYIILILSFSLPFADINSWLNTSLMPESTTIPSFTLEQVLVVNAYQAPLETYYSWVDIGLIFYFVMAALLLFKSIWNFIKTIITIRSFNAKAFSFLGYIKVDNSLTDKDTILRHEEVHIKKWHSLDLLIFEFLSNLLWPNPLVYYLKCDLKNLHEFEADAVAAQSIGVKPYCYLLLSETMNVSPNVFVNQFFEKSTIKQRINMLTKNPTQSPIWLKYGFGTLSFLFMVISFSSFVNKKKIEPITAKIVNNIAPTQVKFLKIDDNQQIIPKSTIKEDTIIIEKPKKYENAYVVIDGVEGGDLESLNPNDIKSISILKDKSAVALYGAKGKDGVILVKTKKGNLEGAYKSFNIKEFYNTTSDNTALNIKIDRKAEADEVVVVSYPLNNSSDPIFSETDELPKFKDGTESMYKIITTNIKYPKEAIDNNIQGKVYVKFIVEKDGSLSNAFIEKGIGFGCNEEALRVVKLMTEWKPAVQNGKAVRSYYRIPIVFKL